MSITGLTSLIGRIFDAADSSIEVHDVLGVGTLCAHIGLACVAAYHNNPIDLSAFGTGAASIIAAMGGAGWMKGKQRAADPSCQKEVE